MRALVPPGFGGLLQFLGGVRNGNVVDKMLGAAGVGAAAATVVVSGPGALVVGRAIGLIVFAHALARFHKDD